MRRVSPIVLLIALGSLALTMATVLQPRADHWTRHPDSGGVLQDFLGEGRRLFANHFFTKADIAFHSGYYPSIFDAAARPKDARHMTEKERDDGHAAQNGKPESPADQEAEHEKDMAFLGKPLDWIDAFGRHFIITDHTHLNGGTEREILPWLKIAADLNPDLPDTYTVAAYWLRDMKKSAEAEAFLREGLRNIPDSYELYFELGRLYLEDRHDPKTAGNLWDLALKKWMAADNAGKKPDLLLLDRIAVSLAKLEESQGNIKRAIALLTLASKASPNPESLHARIRELQQQAGRK